MQRGIKFSKTDPNLCLARCLSALEFLTWTLMSHFCSSFTFYMCVSGHAVTQQLHVFPNGVHDGFFFAFFSTSATVGEKIDILKGEKKHLIVV